jgi:transposase InsO family protein
MDTLKIVPWFFPVKPIKLLNEYDRWRKVAKILKISKEARLRLEWIIYCREGYDASQAARHFGISRKTFYKWYGRFDPDNLHSLHRLEDRSRAPKRVRQREITSTQEQRIIRIRKEHVRWGKEKLAIVYKEEFGERISAWKIQKVIETWKLYHHPEKACKNRLKRRRSKKKRRITELKLDKKHWFQKKAGYIICLDTVETRWNSLKRYIFTAVDKYGKVAYARMYKNKSSRNGEDFLHRLHFLLDGKIPRVGHDNGSEFEKCFRTACEKLKIEQYYSRVRTPKDNPDNERFNRTLREEFIALGNFHSDPDIFNQALTEWLIEYNYKRPHEALGYQTPIKASRLSPMYSSCTRYLQDEYNVLWCYVNLSHGIFLCIASDIVQIRHFGNY